VSRTRFLVYANERGNPVAAPALHSMNLLALFLGMGREWYTETMAATGRAVEPAPPVVERLEDGTLASYYAGETATDE
jgi:hypothetical protein